MSTDGPLMRMNGDRQYYFYVLLLVFHCNIILVSYTYTAIILGVALEI